MTDREKVQIGLETCIKYIDRECPIGCQYHEICTKYEGRVVFQPLLRDAFELLKEQEPGKVLHAKDRSINETHGKTGFCPRCNQLVVWGINRRYCGFCGKRLIWE